MFAQNCYSPRGLSGHCGLRHDWPTGDTVAAAPGSTCRVNSSATLNVWAQWLSDHLLVLTLLLATTAFVAEGMARYGRRSGVADAREHSESRSRTSAKQTRLWVHTWSTNLLLFAATLAITWAISPWITPVLSELLRGRSGLLSMLDLPYAVRVLIGFLLLDLSAYALHWAAHRFGWLWRLHQVHHSDTAMNASTHFRQHPLVLPVALAVQLPVLWAFGIPAVSWVLFAAFSTTVQLWHHSNTSAPAWVERVIGWCLVTPRFHRRHHHPDRAVHDHNYGAVFSWWDRLFRTHSPTAQIGSATPSPTGLADYSANDALSFFVCITAPFSSTAPAQNTTPIRPAAGKRAVRKNSKVTATQYRKTP